MPAVGGGGLAAVALLPLALPGIASGARRKQQQAVAGRLGGKPSRADSITGACWGPPCSAGTVLRTATTPYGAC